MEGIVEDQSKRTDSETITSKGWTHVGAWTEVVGIVENVADDSITILCTSRITLPMRVEDFSQTSNSLHSGQLVAILTLDDGTIRVRVLDEGSSEKH